MNAKTILCLWGAGNPSLRKLGETRIWEGLFLCNSFFSTKDKWHQRFQAITHLASTEKTCMLQVNGGIGTNKCRMYEKLSGQTLIKKACSNPQWPQMKLCVAVPSKWIGHHEIHGHVESKSHFAVLLWSDSYKRNPYRRPTLSHSNEVIGHMN